jgi:hypothetical protein
MRTAPATLLVVAAFVSAALWPVHAALDRESVLADGQPLPIVKTHRYRMAGRVRPLLFWVGRDEVGLAKLAWRAAEDGQRGYDLLVGTDPAKAPRGINRWGFISERRAGSDGAVLAVMSRSDETSLGEAQASVEGGGGSEFKAMRAVTREGVLAWQVARVQAPGTMTIHEIVPLLDRVRTETASVSARSRPVAPESRPGFLLAVAELVDRTVSARPRGDGGASVASPKSLANGPVPYVFGQQSYQLRVASAKAAPLALPGTGRSVPGCVAVFEILNLASGERTRFDMSFATDGPLAGVPITVAWQPRWWLKVELALVE